MSVQARSGNSPIWRKRRGRQGEAVGFETEKEKESLRFGPLLPAAVCSRHALSWHLMGASVGTATSDSGRDSRTAAEGPAE